MELPGRVAADVKSGWKQNVNPELAHDAVVYHGFRCD